ncbi:hypothetical protein PFISCL1PPCAC_23025 [Pristionchus fissidentatus]|uniref:Uncharacterized protein n=1 Tax=Pristionchus fissidentatus TaxID=1538716 RepID=A0AAV5WJW8_9BILA|nr:hypothetical protein PFISCL1PPCAC_23025 [Pristionchus fissidentatus]
MPNLVYYKDGNGVVSGPLREAEATALYRGNFFNPDHVFRMVDSDDVDTFKSIEDLRTQNGIDSPFGKPIDNEERELVRVYKELSTVLKDRNELRVRTAHLEEENKQGMEAIAALESARRCRIAEFEAVMAQKASFTVERFVPPPTCLEDAEDRLQEMLWANQDGEEYVEPYANEIHSRVGITLRVYYGDKWDAHQSTELTPYGSVRFYAMNGTYLFVAPFIPDLTSDDFQHVHKFLYKTEPNKPLKKCEFP